MIIALISDVHGNYPALEAVMENDRFKAADKVYCLGDLVGYYPYPEECTTTIRNAHIPCVMGNHDRACVDNIPCRNNEIGIASLELTRRHISSHSIDFLSKLPERLEIESSEKRIYLVHGSPEHPLNGYVYPDDEVAVPSGFDVLAMGHTHKSFSRSRLDKLIVNPGSVGQPRDATKGASFGLLDLEKSSFMIEWVDYDASEVVRRTEAEGCRAAADALRRNTLRKSKLR